MWRWSIESDYRHPVLWSLALILVTTGAGLLTSFAMGDGFNYSFAVPFAVIMVVLRLYRTGHRGPMPPER